MAVSSLEMHALFVLGDLRVQLVKLFQSQFVYIVEQSADELFMAEIDTNEALVVDDKPGLELKVGDHFRAAVLPSREGGKLELRYREHKAVVSDERDFAAVATPQGQGIVLREGQAVLMVFAAHEQLQGGLSRPLKAAIAKAAKWRAGVMTFKAGTA
ncbi:hypothetical protein [Pseudomonas sp. KNUC1026]|uniref:hypothetical protein n=1 Tax=Pseudomonas sp. KNUC1026 TaxID=2893890 RepID=UPI001F1E5FDB|nr:hypothetical protein [Pseudomonas sp. KNUC1026]UFH51685.1 hypothetical protein LN139_10890 [Pseudomonas sp. KNUC1026]